MRAIRTFFNDKLWPWLVKIIKRLIQWIVKEVVEDILLLLLGIMSLAFKWCPCYRKNIEEFDAVYVFKIKKNDIAVTAIFKDEKMTAHKGEAKDYTVLVTIRDGLSLGHFFGGSSGVFDFILKDGLSWRGNFNYILKFGYLVTHLLYVVVESLKLGKMIKIKGAG